MLLQMQSHRQLLPSQLTIRSYRKGVMALVSLKITSGLLSLVGCDCCSLSLLLAVLWAKGIPLLGRTVLMSSLQRWQEAVPLFPHFWHSPFPAPEGSGSSSVSLGLESLDLAKSLLLGVSSGRPWEDGRSSLQLEWELEHLSAVSGSLGMDRLL